MSQAPASEEAFVPPSATTSSAAARPSGTSASSSIRRWPGPTWCGAPASTWWPLVIGAGAVLALTGYALPGVVLVVLGIAANRLVRRQAGKIVLQLATRDPAVYAEVTSNGVMEVRRA